MNCKIAIGSSRLAAGLLSLCFQLSLSAAAPSLRPTTDDAGPQIPERSVIDLHCHLAGIGAGGSGCFISPVLQRSLKYDAYLWSFGVTRGEIARQGDSVLVDRLADRLRASRTVGRAVLLALDGAIDASGRLDVAATECYVPNEYVVAQVRRHPDLFLFGASINPLRRDALEELVRAKEQGAVLVKWLPNIQGFDPADPRLIPFYRRLAELHLPLLVHTGREKAFASSCDDFGDPARLRLALAQGVTVIAAHAAIPGAYDGEDAFVRLCRLMEEYPRLYADISSLTQANKLRGLRRVMAYPKIHDRLLYGSDYPLIAVPGLCSPWLHVGRLGLRQTWRIARLSNPWDRDVALKQALGFPSAVLSNGVFLRNQAMLFAISRPAANSKT